MEVFAKDTKMEKLISSDRELQKAYGAPTARIIQRRISELRALSNLQMATTLPQLKFHALSGNRKNQWAIKIDGNNRMILIEAHKNTCPPPNTSDISHITAVTITELCIDYH